MTTDRLYVSAVKMNSNQFYKELEKLKDEGLNLLFTNCILSLKITLDSTLATQFDTCLYNEDSNFLLLIDRGNIETNDLKQILKKKDIPFHEAFYHREKPFNNDGSQLKPVYFVKDMSALEEMVKTSKKNSTCIYYPKLGSSVIVKYHDDDEIAFPLDNESCSGLINCPDKFIFLLNSSRNKEQFFADVQDIFERSKMSLVVENESYPVGLKRKERGKLYEKRFGIISRNYKRGS